MEHTIQCDFCSERPVTARYCAESFITPFSTESIIHESVGDWAACSTCESLIDRGDWESLIHRAALKLFQAAPYLTAVTSFGTVSAELRIMYAQLLENNFHKGVF